MSTNKQQALTVARKVLQHLSDTHFWSQEEELQFEKDFDVKHSDIANALPIITALETIAVSEVA
jgi:hypothetical protein